jgi:hypothetical protein
MDRRGPLFGGHGAGPYARSGTASVGICRREGCDRVTMPSYRNPGKAPRYCGPHRAEARAKRDPRYGSSRWRTMAARIVGLPNARRPCWVPSCGRPAAAADHIQPVDAYTTDAEFYNPAGLRPACQRHNLNRGIAVHFEAEVRGTPVGPRRRNSYG